jgi:hypothetical protein
MSSNRVATSKTTGNHEWETVTEMSSNRVATSKTT